MGKPEYQLLERMYESLQIRHEALIMKVKEILTTAAEKHSVCKGDLNCMRAFIGEAWPKIQGLDRFSMRRKCAVCGCVETDDAVAICEGCGSTEFWPDRDAIAVPCPRGHRWDEKAGRCLDCGTKKD